MPRGWMPLWSGLRPGRHSHPDRALLHRFQNSLAGGPGAVDTGQLRQQVAQLGLKYVHNDTCYPALLVIGQFLDALNSGKVAQYFCDFPTEELLGVKGVCCTPHLGASTPESETNCAVMAAAELSDYLKNGNITHSVNLPDVSQPRVGGRRICIIHKNAPGAISAITSILTEAHLNIENMVNKGKRMSPIPCWT